jgi:hypothetical protein
VLLENAVPPFTKRVGVMRHNQSGRDRNLSLNSWCNADKGIYLYLKLGKRDRPNHRIFGQPQVTLIIWR